MKRNGTRGVAGGGGGGGGHRQKGGGGGGQTERERERERERYTTVLSLEYDHNQFYISAAIYRHTINLMIDLISISF